MEKTQDNPGYSIQEGTIIINRDLTELDLFVKDFIQILRKHTDYLVVSGFVSISTGRTRGTEDVDLLVPMMNENKFQELFNDLKSNGFWCYQGETKDIVYPYVKELTSIRFARKNQMFPNIEFIPVDKTKKAKFFELNHPQSIRIKDFEFKIPPIEFEIAYKEIMLGAKKDLLDAKHLRTVFVDIFRKEKFKEYEAIIRSERK